MRFSDALNRRAEDIQRPAVTPRGHYAFAVKKVEQGSVSDGKWDTLEFQCSVVEPVDVDPDDLEAFGGSVVGEPCRKRFMFNTDPAEARAFEQTMVAVRRFLENCNIGFSADSDMTLGEGLGSILGAQFIGEVTHRADKNNPENIYTEIGKTAPR